MGKAGLISTLVFAGAAIVSACAGSAAGAAPQTPPAENAGADACGAMRFASFVGQPESALPRSELPAATRVVCFTCMVTMDFREDRLTIRLGPDGKVESMRCG